MQLSNIDLQFLARLSKSPDGALLLQLFRAKQAESDAKLRTATGEEVFRAQGRSQAIAEIIGDITDAERKLTRHVQLAHRPTQHAA